MQNRKSEKNNSTKRKQSFDPNSPHDVSQHLYEGHQLLYEQYKMSKDMEANYNHNNQLLNAQQYLINSRRQLVDCLLGIIKRHLQELATKVEVEPACLN